MRARDSERIQKIIVEENCTITGQRMKHADTGVESVEPAARAHRVRVSSLPKRLLGALAATGFDLELFTCK